MEELITGWAQVVVMVLAIIAAVVRTNGRLIRIETKVDDLLDGNGIRGKVSSLETKMASAEARIQTHLGD